jgi:hypothetical protein
MDQEKLGFVVDRIYEAGALAASAGNSGDMIDIVRSLALQ